MIKQGLSFVISLLIVCQPISSYAQSSGNLSVQLQKAVDSKEWIKAIQIVDKMIATNPSQGEQLKAYKEKLLEQLHPSVKSPSPSVGNEEYKPSVKQVIDRGTVSITEARIQTDSYGSAGNLTYLSGKIFNGTDSAASNILVYYDIISYDKDNNISGVVSMPLIPPHREMDFKRGINEPITSKQFDSVRVRISKIEWLGEYNKYRSNENRKLFGYWGN